MEAEGAVIIPQLVESLSQDPPAPAGQRGSNSNVHSTHSHKGPKCDEIRKDLFTDSFCNVCGAVLLFESQRISHYEGKKHAQKVRIYFQMHTDLEPGEALDKKKSDHVNFQVDGNEVSDENKFCSLCNMVFSSAVVAQSHYVGKIHAKKLKQATGKPAQNQLPVAPTTPQTIEKQSETRVVVAAPSNPLPPASEKPKQDVKIDLVSLSENPIDMDDPNKYCRLCCAQFNNPLMAKQHYIGKRHTRNRLRKRMMMNLGEESVLSDSNTSVGVATYICPICSVKFSSIEMYHSHMQGNKHQIKENFVVNVMRNSKKSYDSFQDELADYIKVQKARGLEPKTSLRKTEDCYDSCEYDDDDRAHSEGFISERRAPFQRPRVFPENCSRAARNRLPYRASVKQSYFRGQHLQTGLYRTKYQPEPKNMLATSIKVKVGRPSAGDSSDDLRHTSSDDSSGSHHREKRQKRKRRKEKRHRGEDFKKEDAHVEKKRKKCSEDADSEKDNSNLEHKQEDKDTTNEDNLKHRKGKKCKAEPSVDKESKKHKRAKKKKDGDPRTEEEILWDESILGF